MSKSVFDLMEFKPYAGAWGARQKEFALRRSYWDGSVYSQVRWLPESLSIPLSRGIRPLYLPLARAVNVDAGIIPGHWALDESAKSLTSAVNQIFAWSRWNTQGVLYAHYGAMLGSSGLRVSDLREQGTIVISPISPETFILIGAGLYSSTASLALVIESRLNARGERFEYAEAISPYDVRTFADGVPNGFDGRKPVYPHELGIVPIFEVPHINVGLPIGNCCFQNAMLMLDSVNELATDLRTVIQNYRNPQVAIIGADGPEDGVNTMTDGAQLKRSADNAWFIPAGGDAKFLVPNLNIRDTLHFIQDIRTQVEKSMPELAFDELTTTKAVATATVELQLLELILMIQRVRPNYDAGLVQALRLAGCAASAMHLTALAALDSDELAFDSERSILPISSRVQTQLPAAKAGAVNV